MLEKIKTIFIGLLIILTFYQLVDMWSENSLLELFTNASIKSKEENSEYYIVPSSIMISSGDKKFINVKNESAQSELISKYASLIYGHILREKFDFKEDETDIANIINNRSIILCYDDYDEKTYEELFLIKNEKILRNIDKMKKVIIYPNTSEVSKTIVYIEGESKILKFEIALDTTELYGLIDEINMFEQMNIYFLSENYNFKKYFNDIVFIPAIINDKSFAINKYEIVNPFKNVTYDAKDKTKDDDLDLIESYANMFFENPKAKWKMEKDKNVTIFGDGEKSIRVYKDGFASYMAQSESDDDCTIESAIKLANKMIDKDIYSSKLKRLVNVKKINSNTYELYYNFYVGGLEIVLSKDIKDKYKIESPLEITISGDKIISYKSVVLNVTNNNVKDNNASGNMNANINIVSYDEVLDNVYKKKDKTKINDMKIAYYVDNLNNNANIMWIIKKDDKIEAYNAIK